jgi:phosphatidylserine decarboxylase
MVKYQFDMKAAGSQNRHIPVTVCALMEEAGKTTFSSMSNVHRLLQQEDINFLLTNRIPRIWATRFMGWFSRIENPQIRGLSIAVWKYFADDLNLHEAKKTKFASMHDCFIRELKEGVRPIDPDERVVVSPCDAIVGTFGHIRDTELIQAKGFTYTLMDLFGESELVDRYRNGIFVTLRLKSDMYHHFHAPCDCHVRKINYISGDTWNVNPIALKRVEKLFCKNERAVIDLELGESEGHITLVAVAAILVASINLNFIHETLDLKYAGPNLIECDAGFCRGDEMGYFQHGSTIIVFASSGFSPCAGIQEDGYIRMGQALLENT